MCRVFSEFRIMDKKGGQHQAFIMQISFIKSVYCRLISRDACETFPKRLIYASSDKSSAD